MANKSKDGWHRLSQRERAPWIMSVPRIEPQHRGFGLVLGPWAIPGLQCLLMQPVAALWGLVALTNVYLNIRVISVTNGAIPTPDIQLLDTLMRVAAGDTLTH